MTTGAANRAHATIAAMLITVKMLLVELWIHHPTERLRWVTMVERLAQIEEFTAKLRDMDFYHGPVGGAHARRVRNGVGGGSRSVCGSAANAATWGSLSRHHRRSPEPAKLQLLCVLSS